MKDLPDLLTAVVGFLAIVGSGVAWIIKRRDSRKTKVSRNAADVAAVSEAVGGALVLVQSNLTAEIDRQSKVNERLRVDMEQQAEINDRLRSDVDAVKSSSAECLKRIEMLEENEGLLSEWIVNLHEGIEDGSIPPLPSIPDRVVQILDRFRIE